MATDQQINGFFVEAQNSKNEIDGRIDGFKGHHSQLDVTNFSAGEPQNQPRNRNLLEKLKIDNFAKINTLASKNTRKSKSKVESRSLDNSTLRRIVEDSSVPPDTKKEVGHQDNDFKELCEQYSDFQPGYDNFASDLRPTAELGGGERFGSFCQSEEPEEEYRTNEVITSGRIESFGDPGSGFKTEERDYGIDLRTLKEDPLMLPVVARSGYVEKERPLVNHSNSKLVIQAKVRLSSILR